MPRLTPRHLIPSDFVPLSEVATQCGVAPWTAKRAVFRFNLPYVVGPANRIGGGKKIYARPQDVEKVLVTRKGIASNNGRSH